MSFFDQFGKKAGEVAQSAAKTTKQVAAIARMNLSITAEEDKIRKAQIELGKLYYKDFSAGTAPETGEYLPWCERISASKALIEELKEKIANLRDHPAQTSDDPNEADYEVEVDEKQPEPAQPKTVEQEQPKAAEQEQPAQPPISNLYVDETNSGENL